ncbi:MAG: hypothetical protein ACQEXC_09815 [Pseudomonadota bacterium]
MFQIEILTDDKEHARICVDYWRQDTQGTFVFKIQEIADSHEMTAQAVRKLVNQFSYVWLDDVRCSRCEEPYHFTTRTKYQQHRRLRNRACDDCLDAERRAIAEKNQLAIRRLREFSEIEKPNTDNMNISSKIFLFSAIRALGDEQYNTIQPLERFAACTLSPNPDYDSKILKHLIDKNVLLVGFGTRPEAIVVDDDGRISADLIKCEYELGFQQEEITLLIDNFFKEPNLDQLKKSDDFFELCKEVQLHECIAFLNLALSAHQLRLTPGDKTRLVLTQCLDRFSVAQVYNFIWRGAKDAAAYYMRTSIVKKHAANSAISNIARNMERAIAYDWDVKPFHRNCNLPQSALSFVVFNLALGTDDGGFKYPLHTLINHQTPASISQSN